ncbi:MAG: 4-hydroxy-3-methylbut-2-enyl diphosphate reductase [Chlorobi bacterium]|nr:4-hydroxy-3-methylbut-2-enyl diphosphate reductase [Chlorobiota bacterium]
MKISIDETAGFCWGVVRTVEQVEKALEEKKNDNIYVLGDIIHNPREIERLAALGLKTITHDDFERIAPEKPLVIIRAHGEPPETYRKAEELGIELMDATCPLVQQLQNRINDKHKEGYDVVIFGKEKHAEVIGLRGVCNDQCTVVSTKEEALEKINVNRKTVLFSQTTMDKPTFFEISEVLEEKVKEKYGKNASDDYFQSKDTICKHVYGRIEDLEKFAESNDVILFVAGKNSSNGKILYNVCKSKNERTYFIEDISEIDTSLLKDAKTIGITGATSTPQWFMEAVQEYLEKE